MADNLRILFLDTANTAAPLAAGLLQKTTVEGIEAKGAGLELPKDGQAVRDSAEVHGLTLPPFQTFGDLAFEVFDLVISLSDDALAYCLDAEQGGDDTFEAGKAPLYIGNPAHVHWELGTGGPLKSDGDSALDELAEDLRGRIDSLIGQGTLRALAAQRAAAQGILDGLEDGVIIHDDRRRIFMFNKAAEQLAGVDRERILGRDCHEVFAPHGLCGGQCRFKTVPETPLEPLEYTFLFNRDDGEERRLKINSRAHVLLPGRRTGVLATVRDVTEISDLRRSLKRKRSFHGLVGVTPVMREVFELIRQVASSDYSALITGESGTGKELVAAAVHNESRRKGGPFVPINCGALPETILESELFGHVRGAFTGAIRDKKGRFELADKGTLFFDEVEELSPAFQVKLLRVLETKRFERVGGEQTVSVDVRIIAATNRSLRQMVEEGSFREDLFYRLCVVPIHLPPLRQRRQDIPLLTDHFLREIRKETGREFEGLSNSAMDCLLRYRWPGNVRELINALQFGAVRCPETVIGLPHLPPEVQRCLSGEPVTPEGEGELSAPGIQRRTRLDADSVRRALVETGGNKVKAAKALGVGRATLYRFLKNHPVS